MLAITKTRFHRVRTRLEEHVAGGRWQGRAWEFGLFVFKQGWACLFGGLLLSLVLVTKWLWPVHALLARYDFLFVCAVAIQIGLLLLRLETVREAKVILIFHVVGTVMELFKTSVGSWTYPGGNVLRIAGVPLFSGFMYASVGSYLARAGRILEMRYTGYPRMWMTYGLAVLIYANFFLHHYLPDIRWVLFVLVAVLYGRTWVYYRPYQKVRRMPLVLGFGLVALFLWVAENVGTFGAVWRYPAQQNGWRMVGPEKYGAWYLLMLISFVLVTLVNPPERPDERAEKVKRPRRVGEAVEG